MDFYSLCPLHSNVLFINALFFKTFIFLCFYLILSCDTGFSCLPIPMGLTRQWGGSVSDTSPSNSARRGSVGTDVFPWNVTPVCPPRHCESKRQSVCHLDRAAPHSKGRGDASAHKLTRRDRESYLIWVIEGYQNVTGTKGISNLFLLTVWLFIHLYWDFFFYRCFCLRGETNTCSFCKSFLTYQLD